MELTQDDVIQILEIIDNSDFDEIHLEQDGFKLTLRRGEAKTPPDELPLSSNLTHLTAIGRSAALGPKEDAIPIIPAQTKIATGESVGVAADDKDFVRIKAPMLGTFYKSSKPGAPPFVDVGSFVNEESTLCLIEVMKCFSPVKAKVPGGYIVKVLAEDGQMVEYDQELFLVKLAPNA